MRPTAEGAGEREESRRPNRVQPWAGAIGSARPRRAAKSWVSQPLLEGEAASSGGWTATRGLAAPTSSRASEEERSSSMQEARSSGARPLAREPAASRPAAARTRREEVGRRRNAREPETTGEEPKRTPMVPGGRIGGAGVRTVDVSGSASSTKGHAAAPTTRSRLKEDVKTPHGERRSTTEEDRRAGADRAAKDGDRKRADDDPLDSADPVGDRNLRYARSVAIRRTSLPCPGAAIEGPRSPRRSIAG